MTSERMRGMWRLAFLVALTANCGVEVDMSLVVDPPPGIDAAESLITERYRCEKATVYWYGPAAFTCVDALGYPGFPSPVSGRCVDGDSWGTGVLVIGLKTIDTPIWKTTLVHEYAHRSIGDAGHTREPWWGRYNQGQPGGLVEDTRVELKWLSP